METTLENPVIKEDFESKLLEAADAVDHGDDFQLPSADQSEPRTPDTTEQSSPDTTPEKKDERPRDERGRFTKTPEGADIPESERTDAPVDKPDVAKIGDGKQTEVKPESEYAKAKKDAERKDRSWQALEAEKSQARAQIEAERRAIAEERQRLQQQAQPQRQQQSQYSSKDYAKFAQDCSKAATEARERGDYDEADMGTEPCSSDAG
jgi:pyocin large subunit-like protein